MLSKSPAELAAAAALLLMLGLACATDLRSRRIPNVLVAVVLVAGVLVTTAFDPFFPGLWRAVAGMGLGLALWLPGWLLRMMGAGDVKLFAAAGAWLGPAGVVNASLVAAVAGGVLALGWMLVRRGRADTGRMLHLAALAPRALVPDEGERGRRDLVPYSLAITAGVLVQLAFPGLVLG